MEVKAVETVKAYSPTCRKEIRDLALERDACRQFLQHLWIPVHVLTGLDLQDCPLPHKLSSCMSLPCAQHCTNLLLCEMLNTKFPCSRPTSCSDRHLLLKTGRSGEIPGTLREKDRAVLSHLPTREGHLCFRKQALLIPASSTRDSTRCCLMKIACQRTRQGGPEQTTSGTAP